MSSCELFYSKDEGMSLEQRVNLIEDKYDLIETQQTELYRMVNKLNDDYYRIQDDFLQISGKIFQEVNELEAKVDVLGVQTGANSAAITGLQAEILALAATVGGAILTIGALTALTDWIQNIGLGNKANKSDLEAANQKIEENNQKIEQTNLDIARLDGEIEAQKSSLEYHFDLITDLQNQDAYMLDGIDRMTDEIDKNNSALESQINQVFLELSKIEDKNYDQEIDRLDTRIDSLASGGDGGDNKINNLENEFNNLENEFNRLKQQLDSEIDKNKELTDKLEDLVNKYNELVEKYNNLGLDVQDILNQINNILEAIRKIQEDGKEVDITATIEAFSSLLNNALNQVTGGGGSNNFQLTQDVNEIKDLTFQLERTIENNKTEIDDKITKIETEKTEEVKELEKLLEGVKQDLSEHESKPIPDAHTVNVPKTYPLLEPSVETTVEEMIQPDLTELLRTTTETNVKIDNLTNKTTNIETNVTNIENNVTNINNPELPDWLEPQLERLNEETAIINNTTNNITQDITNLALEVGVIFAFANSVTSGALSLGCRFQEDPYSPQILNDTTQIKTVQTGHAAVSTSTNTMVVDVQNKTNLIDVAIGTTSPIGNGGITGGLKRLYDTLGVDRWLSLLQTAILLHNAQMLSTNLAQTLINLGDTMLDAAGFEFKDAEGNQVGVREIVNTTVYNLASSILGRDLTNDIIDTYKRATRLYQAASNMLYALQGIMDATRDLVEISVENTGKIGNALKQWGIVGEDSYPWMTDKVTTRTAFQQRIQSLNETLQDITNVVDVFEQATSNVIEIQENYKEFRDSKEVFENELKAWEESEATKKNDDKEASKGPSIDNIHLVKQED